MQFFTIYLPTKRYLRKYLQKTYGNPLVLNPNSEFGAVVLSKMGINLHSKLDAHDIDLRLERMTDKLPIKVGMDWWYRLKIKEINQHQAVYINRYFEPLFVRELHMAVERGIIMGKQRQDAIEEFAASHGIELEEDVTFECLKKMEYRYRKELEEKSKKPLSVLSPALSLF